MKDLLEQQALLSGRMPVALRWLYLILITLAVVGLGATWFIHMDVVVNAKGIIRPARERTSVRAPVGGIIDSIWINEGQFIRKGERIAVLKDEQRHLIGLKLEAEVSGKQALLQDLSWLTGGQSFLLLKTGTLKTTLYQEQLAQFVQQLQERRILLAQTQREFEVAGKLAKDRIISPAEFDATRSIYLQRSASLNSSIHQQLAVWNNEKQQLTEAIGKLQQQQVSLLAENEKMQLIAPVSGFVMGIQEHYTQGFLQSGEVLCSISPEDSLIAECFVGTNNIGFLAPNQGVSIKVDAFDHKQFGLVHGIIHSIDNDFSIINEIPVFKIRCSIANNTLFLKNGYSANLKKGMTIQARVMITQRTIWQLFFDRLHNWLEPVVTV